MSHLQNTIASAQQIRLFGRSLLEIIVIVMAVSGFGTAISDHFNHHETIALVDAVKILGAGAMSAGATILAFLLGRLNAGSDVVRLTPQRAADLRAELGDEQLEQIFGAGEAHTIRAAARRTDDGGHT